METKEIIMFSGNFCHPCKIAYPIIKNYCYEHNITFNYKLVEECEEDILNKYDINGVPTFILIDDENNQIKKLNGWNKEIWNQILI